MSRALYSRLFGWLVTRINQSVHQPDDKDSTSIAILDIFGFEVHCSCFLSLIFYQICKTFIFLQKYYDEFILYRNCCSINQIFCFELFYLILKKIDLSTCKQQAIFFLVSVL